MFGRHYTSEVPLEVKLPLEKRVGSHFVAL